jgi:site-specific DNA-methyltransferase (adenine-specific)
MDRNDDIQILQADARSLPLEDGSVDLLFGDPPYNQDVKYGAGVNDLIPDEDYVKFTFEWIKEAARVLKPTGTMWVMLPDEWVSYGFIFMRSFLTYRNWIKWHETFGNNCTKKFSRTSRHVLYFVKDPKQFTFNDKAIRVPSARQAKYGDKRANPAGKVPDDVWVYSRVCGTFKERIKGAPTQVPEALMERIILSTSNEGDQVVDPFSGAGTTASVCKKVGRQCVAFDLLDEFVDMGRRRLEDKDV